MNKKEQRNYDKYGCFMGDCKLLGVCEDDEAKKGIWGKCLEFEKED